MVPPLLPCGIKRHLEAVAGLGVCLWANPHGEGAAVDTRARIGAMSHSGNGMSINW